MAKAKAPKEIILKVPEPMAAVQQWLVIGIDPSLSRTGYAVMHVQKEYEADAGASPNDPPPDAIGTSSTWMEIGSLKPEFSSDPDWVRSKAMAKFLKKAILDAVAQLHPSFNMGLIISFEYPTPMNTHLTSLNRILHLMVLDEELAGYFSTVRIQMTNAATLRSLMGLTKTGAKNKVENIAKAYEFVDRGKFPELDTDSCDGVLLAMMSRFTASIALGFPKEVPERFLNKLCDAGQSMKGNGRNAKIITNGLLHRHEYWYGYTPAEYQILLKDASNPKKKLERIPFSI